MRKFVYMLGMLLSFSSAAEGQLMFSAKLNTLDPKEWGPPVVASMTSASLERRNIPAVPITVEVRLRRKIMLGCQFYYRVTTAATAETVRITAWAVSDQKYEEKMKPGKPVEFLANTLDRRERGDPEGDDFCIGKEPSFIIDEINP